jgi:hypothetical protein
LCGKRAPSPWLPALRRTLYQALVQADRETQDRLAALLDVVGSPEDPDAKRVLRALLKLLSARRPGREATPAVLDTLERRTGEELVRVARAVEAYECRMERDLRWQDFRLAPVIEVMLQMPDPEPCVERLHEHGYRRFAAVFSAKALRCIKSDPKLRGVFWDGARHAPGGRPLDGVRVITDDDEDEG